MENKKIDFNFVKNDYYDLILSRYYDSFTIMLDTEDFVPIKFNNYICKRYFKNLKKDLKLANKKIRKEKKFWTKFFNKFKFWNWFKKKNKTSEITDKGAIL